VRGAVRCAVDSVRCTAAGGDDGALAAGGDDAALDLVLRREAELVLRRAVALAAEAQIRMRLLLLLARRAAGEATEKRVPIDSFD
jgi:hypothetical protein